MTIRSLVVVDGLGAASPPRRNGELVFEAPWESRSFGIAVALADTGVLDFEVFRGRLIDEIQSWQTGNPGSSEGWSYYERWEHALEQVLIERGVMTRSEIEERVATIAHARAHDHDH